jgi:hypothetical protein
MENSEGVRPCTGARTQSTAREAKRAVTVRQGFRSHLGSGVMNKLIGQKWKRFRQIINNWLLTMDADPLEDMHRRVRRLEVAISQMEAGRRFTEPDRVTLRE